MKRKLLFLFSILLVHSLVGQDFMMQGWYWDYPKTAQGNNWMQTLQSQAAGMQGKFTYMWLPPLAKPSFGNGSNGYDPKDLYDYGEFSGGCPWGYRSDLNGLISQYNAYGIKAVADVVYNHRDGGRPENNPAVEDWVKNFNGSQGSAFPSDRMRCILPIGSGTQNGAGDYYFKIRSNSQNTGWYGNKPYKFYIETNRTRWQNQADLQESEPNGGGDCGQAFNVVSLGRNIACTTDGSGCLTDEFKLTLNTAQFNAADTLYIYFSNQDGNYSDHRIYSIWNAARSQDIAGELKYQTYTDFTRLPSGRGGMNYQQFKPNGSNATNLGGDQDWMWFFYDYEQANSKCQDVLNEWTRWNWSDVGIRGLRMDAVKHFPASYVSQLMNNLNANGMNPGMVVGENFDGNPAVLKGWVDAVTGGMNNAARSAINVRVFDFALRNALKSACDGFGYDVRNVYSSGIVGAAGGSGFQSVSFVNNHDFRSSGEPVQNDPKLAYAYILTNNTVGVPCVFYPDYFGVQIPNSPTHNLQSQIDKLIDIHKKYIFGSNQLEYLNKEGSFYLNGSNYLSAGAGASKATTMMYQIKGGIGGRDVIVAINYSGTTLKVDQLINGAGNPAGTKFDDLMGNSAFPTAQVDGGGRIYIELPPRSYSVWVRQGSTPTAINVTATTVKHVSCFGGTDGSVTVQATGGNNCSYLWSNGQNGATLSNVKAGVYSCIANCGGQTGAYSVTITQPNTITAGTLNSTAITCANLGSAQVVAVGGNGTLTYTWSNNATGSSIQVATPGTYTVTVADAKICNAVFNVNVIEDKIPPTAQIIATGGLNCKSSAVGLTNSVIQNAFTYKWLSPLGITTNSKDITTTQQGTYNLTVTNTSNQCTNTATYNVKEDKTPPKVAIPSNVTINCVTPTPQLDASPSTGTGTLSFKWSGPGIVSGANTAKAIINTGGTYVVVVTDENNGCTASLSKNVTQDLSTQTVSITGNGVIDCNVKSLTLKANSSAANATYSWSGPQNFTADKSDAIINNAGVYSVTATSPTGCKSISSVTVTEDKTVPEAEIEGKDGVCQGTPTTLKTNIPFAAYQWNTGQTSATIAVNTAGIKSVTVTASNGCTKVLTKDLNLLASPIVSIPTDTLTCDKNSIQLAVNSVGNLTSTIWAGPNNYSSNLLSPVFFNTGVYTLTATNDLGCSAKFSTIIYQDKNVPVVNIAGATNLCIGSSTTLTATPNLGTYAWSNGNNTNTITTNQVGQYTLTVTDTKNCKSINIIQVKNIPNPIINATDAKVCEGNEAKLITTTNTTESLTYAWTFNNILVGNSAILTIANTNVLNSGDYIVTAKTAEGCVGTTTVKLTIAPKLSANIEVKNDCADNAIVTAKTLTGTAPFNYKWNNNATTPSINVNAPTTVNVTITDAIGCQTVQTKTVGTSTISLSAQVTAATNSNSNGAILLKVTSTYAPFTFKWDNGATSQNLQNVKAGQYCVTVTDTNGCSEEACITISKDIISTKDKISQQWKIYPNPTENMINIETSLRLERIEVLNYNGQLVLSQDQNLTQLDVTMLPSGMYILKGKDKEGQLLIAKFVKL